MVGPHTGNKGSGAQHDVHWFRGFVKKSFLTRHSPLPILFSPDITLSLFGS